MTQDHDMLNPMFPRLGGNAVSAATMLQNPPIMMAAQEVMRNPTVEHFMGGGVLPPTRGGGFSIA